MCERCGYSDCAPDGFEECQHIGSERGSILEAMDEAAEPLIEWSRVVMFLEFLRTPLSRSERKADDAHINSVAVRSHRRRKYWRGQMRKWVRKYLSELSR